MREEADTGGVASAHSGCESMNAGKRRAAANTWDRQHQDKAEPGA